MPAVLESPPTATKSLVFGEDALEGWLVFVYLPAALFSLKASWATSTAGKTLLTPTPYAIKMAFLDVTIRHGLVADPNALVRSLAKVNVRVGLPAHACVTEMSLRIRQETREADRELDPSLPPHRPNMALRQMVHYQGDLRIAFDRGTCAGDLEETLRRAAPAINYLGKRGGFVQYLEHLELRTLDETFTAPVAEDAEPMWGHRAILDDFGPGATFEALNSYTATDIKRGVHRKFVNTHVPLGVWNTGPGFWHYSHERSAMP